MAAVALTSGSALALTGGALIGLMAVASAAFIAATLLSWRRMAQPGARHVLARFGLLLGTNLAVTFLIFVVVNRVFGFYISWAELLGTSKSTGMVQAGPGESASPTASPGGTVGSQAGPPGPLPGSPQPDGQAPEPPGSLIQLLGTQQLAAGQANAGHLQSVRLRGGRSGLSPYGYVYLPPQYSAAGSAGHQLAVVVVISDSISPPASSGGSGGPAPAAGRGTGPAAQLALTAYGQVAAGRAAPAIYVMLPATLAPGDEACIDVPRGPQAGTFFSQDLPATLRAAYRVPSGPAGWGLLGGASGGYCAVKLAMTSSDRFAVAAAPAADYRLPPGVPAAPGVTPTPRDGSAAHQDRRTPVPWLFGGSPLLQNEADLLWRLRDLPPPPVTVLFAGANAGDLGRARAFMSAVRPPMKASTVSPAAPTGGQPTAPVIDRMTRELSAWG
jgi:hypothetical protein